MDSNISGIFVMAAGDIRAINAKIKASTPRLKSEMYFLFIRLWVRFDVLLNIKRPNNILSVPIDNNTTESTVTTTSADRLGNPNDSTREDSIRDTDPDPICTARNHFGESYLTNTG